MNANPREEKTPVKKPIFTGIKMVFGVVPSKPIRGTEGKDAHLVMAPNRFACVTIVEGDKVVTGLLEDKGDYWQARFDLHVQERKELAR